MPTAIEIVEDFLAGWDEPGGFKAKVERHFTDATTWENVGMGTTTGIAQAVGLFDAMGGADGPARMRVTNLAVAQVGDTVLTERVDDILGPDGQAARSFRVMGAFEVQGGKIVAWRDYFDTASLASGG